MSRRKKGAAPAAPALLTSLSREQEELLREAAEKAPKGVYVPLGGHIPAIAYALAIGGAAESRCEVKISDTPRSVNDPRPCTWTDHYIVPSEYGLQLLNGCSAKGKS